MFRRKTVGTYERRRDAGPGPGGHAGRYGGDELAGADDGEDGMFLFRFVGGKRVEAGIMARESEMEDGRWGAGVWGSLRWRVELI